MTTTIAVANQKGGVGKTTTTINLGALLAERGYRVLIVDLDPQGNASTGLGLAAEQRELSCYDLLLGEAKADKIRRPTPVAGLDIVPASSDLSSAELELAGMTRRVQVLKNALRSVQADVVLIDCPPALGLLTLNALVAADAVLVPLQAEFYALEGLSQLLSTVREVRSGANAQLRIGGIVVTMSDLRNNLAQQVEADARATLGELVFKSVIPRNVRVSEAPSFGLPVVAYDGQSKGAIAYRDLADEVIEKIIKN